MLSKSSNNNSEGNHKNMTSSLGDDKFGWKQLKTSLEDFKLSLSGQGSTGPLKEKKVKCWREDVLTDRHSPSEGLSHSACAEKTMWHTWLYTNWATTYQSEVLDVFAPRTLDSLKKILSNAHSKGVQPVRAVGSGHSWNSLSEATNGWLIMIKNLSEVEYNPLKQTLLASPGTLVRDLESCLEEDRRRLYHRKKVPAGRSLALTTVETKFTIAGLVSTGCHGSGRGSCMVPDMVASISLLIGENQLIEETFTPADPEFRALILNLGSFGVISKIELNTVENSMARSCHYRVPMEGLFGMNLDSPQAPDILDGPARALRELVEVHDFVDINWSPFNDSLWIIQIDKVDDIPFDPSATLHKDLKSEIRWLESSFVSNFWYHCISGHFLSELCTPLICKLAFEGMVHERYTQQKPWEKYVPLARALHWEVTCDAMPCTDLEICFPVRRLEGTKERDFRPVVFAWNAMLQLTKAYEKNHRYPLNLFAQIRFVRGSEYGKHALLCPSVCKDELDLWCYIEVLSVRNTLYWSKYMAEMCLIWLFCDPLSVPHWAKEFPQTGPCGTLLKNRLKHVYGKYLNQWDEVRRKLDPKGIYSNQFIHWLLSDIDNLNEPLIETAGVQLNEWDTKWKELAQTALDTVLIRHTPGYPDIDKERLAKLTQQQVLEAGGNMVPPPDLSPFPPHPEEIKNMQFLQAVLSDIDDDLSREHLGVVSALMEMDQSRELHSKINATIQMKRSSFTKEEKKKAKVIQMDTDHNIDPIISDLTKLCKYALLNQVKERYTKLKFS